MNESVSIIPVTYNFKISVRIFFPPNSLTPSLLTNPPHNHVKPYSLKSQQTIPPKKNPSSKNKCKDKSQKSTQTITLQFSHTNNHNPSDQKD